MGEVNREKNGMYSQERERTWVNVQVEYEIAWLQRLFTNEMCE